MKYEKIIDYITNQIDKGSIKPGEKMPSIRELCAEFNCSKATAVRAYYDLKENEIVYAVPGSGYYLIGKAKTTVLENGIIDLSGSELDKDVIPYDDFESCLNQAINKYKDDLFG